ncbi:PREDICTED: ABC transporter G family member 22-like isoform X2 [Nelumbo nucifera]|uniref:ABC transporter G family member 22-like isoform X2 n=1 Tax=Nelumbo nucifera TaxID=4432 RepID=A0A1U7Z8M4_NELNU|nr:PREDICTED: ABC transporter G family member 22-like isoform X2 [Nelumbo nucifera]
MEVKQGITVTKTKLQSQNFDEIGEDVSRSTSTQLSISIPAKKDASSSKTLSITGQVDSHSEPEDGSRTARKRSLGMKMDSSSEKLIHKTKSLSAHFLVDIDKVIKNDTGSFGETSSMHDGASRSHLGFSFSLAGATVGFDDISDVRRLKKTKHIADFPLSYDDDDDDDDDDQDQCNWKKIQIEPTLPICLKFQDVRYKVALNGRRSSDAEKYILHGVTGSVHPGEVLALMGPSGGGKTTLLNLLSGRVKTDDVSCSITYNDQPYSKSLKRRIGFVMQDDVAFPHLTVKETLTYAALLRLPNTLTKQQKEERAMNVISELDLERCQNTIIGGSFVRGISGGERKRVCIGNEILLNPSLLFLDEPTSGLDSTTALRIVQMLHNIAKAGKTVVTTIHQPSSRLFNKFDKLILLSRGNSLYFGKASEAMLYFSSIGCSPLIVMNPAEFLIDLANGNINDKSIPSVLEDKILLGSQFPEKQDGRPSPVDVHEYLVGAYETRVANIEKQKLLKPVMVDSESEIQGMSHSIDWGASWWEQYSILFRRGLKERRHEYLSCLRVTQVVSTAIIIGLLWWHSDASSPKRLQDQAGLLFFISVFWGFFPVFTAIFTFPQERAMLAKERAVGMYKLSAYFIARNASDLPLDLILPIVFLVIVYFMVGLKQTFSAFSLSMLTLFLTIVSAQGLGLAIGAAFMDVKKATTLASVLVMTFMLAGGFFVQKVPSFMSWIRYISINYHTYRLLLKIQYSCSGSGHGSAACDSPFIKGLKIDDGGKEAGAMITMIFGYRLLAYLFLRGIKLRKRD